jgi:hypothetical protein
MDFLCIYKSTRHSMSLFICTPVNSANTHVIIVVSSLGFSSAIAHWQTVITFLYIILLIKFHHMAPTFFVLSFLLCTSTLLNLNPPKHPHKREGKIQSIFPLSFQHWIKTTSIAQHPKSHVTNCLKSLGHICSYCQNKSQKNIME